MNIEEKKRKRLDMKNAEKYEEEEQDDQRTDSGESRPLSIEEKKRKRLDMRGDSGKKSGSGGENISADIVNL